MCRRSLNRRGLSLIELLTATSILTLMAGAIAALASTVQLSSRHGQGHADATQHARVALERIERTITEATASPEFPGCAMFAETVGGTTFPDTLVVWHPSGGTVANPAGRPLFSELAVFRVDSLQPNVLAEITVPGYAQVTPPLSDTAAWISALAALRTQASYTQITLTDLLRTVSVSDNVPAGAPRGAVRFDVARTPSDAELADYRSGVTTWKNLPWVQGICGTTTGLRQSHCRIELQLMPGRNAQGYDPSGATVIPYFGSAALYHEARQ